MVHRAPRSCLCLPTWRALMPRMPLRLEAGFSLVHITLSSIHPLVPHSSIGPPFIHRENSVRERDWGFVRGRPRLNGHTLLWASGRRRCRLSLYRVSLG